MTSHFGNSNDGGLSDLLLCHLRVTGEFADLQVERLGVLAEVSDRFLHQSLRFRVVVLEYFIENRMTTCA